MAQRRVDSKTGEGVHTLWFMGDQRLTGFKLWKLPRNSFAPLRIGFNLHGCLGSRGLIGQRKC
ncbi:hypothetical protein C5688_19265 [Methylocystis sp. MitZ-2018]|nr:hypothetical protein C5688_19265 [Methylocystis sp. MitZ-2018]